MRDQYLQSEECKELGIESEECTVESIRQASSSNLVIEPPCYEGNLPFVLSFNATKISNESAALGFGLYENETGETIPAVTYIVSMAEVGSNKTLLADAFHAPNGTLFLPVVRDRESGETVFEGADRERFLDALVANTTEPIIVHSPEISLGRTSSYDIQVSVLGAYNVRCLFPPDLIPEASFVWNPQNGNLREVVVVPEFSAILLSMLLASIIGAATAYNRIRW